MTTTQTTRRQFLAAVGGIGAATALAACNPRASDGGSAPQADFNFTFPSPPDGFPAEDVTVRALSAQDKFWAALTGAFQEKFPDITIEAEKLTGEQITEVVPLGFRNKTAHDITQLAESIRLQDAVADGLLTPFNDIIPNFDEWQSAIPEMGRIEGIQVFDGKQYAVAPITEERHQYITYYNKKLMNDAGYDPASEPLTWDTFRDACRKVTKAGNGRAYGYALEIGQLSRVRRWFLTAARLAGLKTDGDLSHATGEYIFDSQEMLAAIELVQSVMADGSMFPGSTNLTAPEAWSRVVRGNSAMCSAGPWVCTQWLADEPSFDFGVAQMPVPGGVDPLPPAHPPFGANRLHVPSFSKVKTVAGYLLGYATSLNGQIQLGKAEGVGSPPYLPEAQKAAFADLSPQEKRCHELGTEQTFGPEPVIRNPDISLVDSRLEPVSPSLPQILQAILVGEETNPKKALTKLRADSDRALDTAIAEAKKIDGSTATRDDYVFPDWNPRQDYTLDQYQRR